MMASGITSLISEHIDLANQLWRRIEDNGRSVDVAAINRCVHDYAGGAPLPRNRIVTARIVGNIDPLWIDIFEIRHLVWARFKQQTFGNPDRHVVR
jgi:hypothetical protein